MMCWCYIWSSMNSWKIIDVGINMRRKDLMKLKKMRDSYLKRDVLTGVEEEYDNVNETNILGLTDDNIIF
jgi:hypothetical protein